MAGNRTAERDGCSSDMDIFDNPMNFYKSDILGWLAHKTYFYFSTDDNSLSKLFHKPQVSDLHVSGIYDQQVNLAHV